MKKMIISNIAGNYGVWEFTKDYREFNPIEVFVKYSQAVSWINDNGYIEIFGG